MATKDDALRHLGKVLMILSDLHPDDRCEALDSALAFYNEHCPDWRVTPSGFGFQRLTPNPIDK
jgi:hypothetical protein